MQLKLYLNKETVRLFRIVSPSSDDFIKLFPVNFLRIASGGYKIVFMGSVKAGNYDVLYRLYEPFITERPVKFEYSINNIEILRTIEGETIWYIPSKIFIKYIDGYELSENHSYEEEEHE